MRVALCARKKAQGACQDRVEAAPFVHNRWGAAFFMLHHGKGKHKRNKRGIPSAIFEGEKKVEIALRDEIAKEIRESKENEEIAALRVWEMRDNELFLVNFR